MSFNHENVIWRTAEGAWRRGFFVRIPGGNEYDDDYDAEWDDDYDYTRFETVSRSFISAESCAEAPLERANPGGHTEYDDPVSCQRYDVMAAELTVSNARAAAADRRQGVRWS